VVFEKMLYYLLLRAIAERQLLGRMMPCDCDGYCARLHQDFTSIIYGRELTMIESLTIAIAARHLSGDYRRLATAIDNETLVDLRRNFGLQHLVISSPSEGSNYDVSLQAMSSRVQFILNKVLVGVILTYS